MPEALLAEPDGPWELRRTSIKPWPCCRHTHPTIDAGIELHAEIAGRRIAEVEVATYRAALDLCDRPMPDDGYGAKFSLQHTVAAALADGKVDQAAFSKEARSRLADTRAKVRVSVSPEVDRAYPEAWGAAVSVRTADGHLLHARRVHCKGDPENPVSEADLIAKAHDLLASGGLGRAAADRLIDAVLGLTGDTRVRDLALFSGPGRMVPAGLTALRA